ncbi:MAG: HRDC domain-containing protein [Cyclobacteriaceae bacterium]
MKVKVFHIRLTIEDSQSDQDRLNSFFETVTVEKTATELVTTGQSNFWSILVFYDDQKIDRPERISDKLSVISDSELSEEEKRIYEALRQWRQNRAIQLGMPSYIVAHNTELMTIAKSKPQTLDELSKIKGFGGQKAAKYGEDIIALLNSI